MRNGRAKEHSGQLTDFSLEDSIGYTAVMKRETGITLRPAFKERQEASPISCDCIDEVGSFAIALKARRCEIISFNGSMGRPETAAYADWSVMRDHASPTKMTRA
jgi:hypothetical protein